ncbi:unnamed protein product [Triticum turgidum subsp. durum]|uniref:Uncharacterized protein n=1 Tax=Triticum turgidum subsp. durum TaxID=4567 RepID=A0A9R0RZR3_TRITD|nr:unnamed protein product [Triticum turgidum subsp. durum]
MMSMDEMEIQENEIDHTEAELEEEEADRLSHKYARYRLKACLLLKGMPIDDAALECKYTPELALDYLSDGAFGWCFDLNLCLPVSLSDYQRLVPCNEGGDEYESWSEYREFYSTTGTDRDYLLYWDTIVKDLKWIEEHVLKSFSEWHELHEKASCQAVRIAARFTNIHPRLAYYGFLEYKQSTRFYLKFVKDLDYVFFEIWKLVNRQICFRDAMQHVYEENPFPLRKRELERELSRSGSFRLEEQFRRCTEGISKEVPEWIARKLISQEVRFKCALPKTYAQYARKKLKIAEVIGLIPKAEIQA